MIRIQWWILTGSSNAFGIPVNYENRELTNDSTDIRDINPGIIIPIQISE